MPCIYSDKGIFVHTPDDFYEACRSGAVPINETVLARRVYDLKKTKAGNKKVFGAMAALNLLMLRKYGPRGIEAFLAQDQRWITQFKTEDHALL